MKVMKALVSGFAGALTVTVLNEFARRVAPDEAPRLDLLGMRAVAKTMRAAGEEPPIGDELRTAAMAGDLVSNTLYYSLVGLGGESKTRTWGLGALLGTLAGAGGVVLPPKLGLGRDAVQATPGTQVMTFLWYLYGGLTAAFMYRALED